MGSVESFVGRNVVNLRTLDEPYSFFGVDLGVDRKLVPSCYTLRNRNASTHVLMNWHFEASNDRINWTMLDRRIYLTNSPEHDKKFEEEHKEFKTKGGSSTCCIDTDLYREIGYEGFRYFRVIQVGKNSSGTDNLALSGFELYGQVKCGRWP